MQQPGRVAQMPVRDDLREVHGRQPPEHLAAGDDQPAVLEHAHFPPVLGLDLRRRLLARDRLRVVDRTPAPLHHHVRQRQVVAEPRIDLDVVRAPHRVDRAVAAGDRAERRLLRAQPGLEAPVDALAVGAGRVGQHEPAADVGDVGVGERRARACAARRAPTSRSRRRRRPPPRCCRGRRGSAPRPSRRAGSAAGARPRAASTSSSVRSTEASDATTSSSLSRG